MRVRYIKLGTCMHEICMSCSGHRMYKDCCNLLFEHSLEGAVSYTHLTLPTKA